MIKRSVWLEDRGWLGKHKEPQDPHLTGLVGLVLSEDKLQITKVSGRSMIWIRWPLSKPTLPAVRRLYGQEWKQEDHLGNHPSPATQQNDRWCPWRWTGRGQDHILRVGLTGDAHGSGVVGRKTEEFRWLLFGLYEGEPPKSGNIY